MYGTSGAKDHVSILPWCTHVCLVCTGFWSVCEIVATSLSFSDLSVCTTNIVVKAITLP